MAALLFSLLFLVAPAMVAQQPRLVLPIGHTGQLNAAEFSRDGRYAVTVSNDGSAMLWGATTGKLLENFRANGDASAMNVTEAKFSDDGKLLFISYEGTHFICYDIEAAKKFDPEIDYKTLSDLLDSPEGWTLDQIIQLFSKDSKHYLYTTYTDMYKPTVYSLETGKPDFRLKEQQGQVLAASFSNDGKKIITLGIDSAIRLWNGQTGQLIKKIPNRKYNYTTVEFTPDGKYLLCVSDQKDLHMIDPISGKVQLEFGKGRITNFQFSKDKRYVLIFSGAKEANHVEADSIPYSITLYDTASVWELSTGTKLYDITGLDLWLDDVMFDFFSPDGNKLILPGKEKATKIRDTKTGQVLFELNTADTELNMLRFDKADKKLLTLSSDNSIVIRDAENGSVIQNLNLSRDSLFNVSFSSDGTRIIAAANRKAIIWDVITGNRLAELKGHSNTVLSACLSVDNNSLVLKTENAIKVYDLVTGKVSALLDRPDSNFLFEPHHKVYQEIVSPDSSLMTCNYGVNLLSICKCTRINDGGEKMLMSGDVLLELNSFETINDVQFSADNKNLVVTYENSRINVYDLINKKQRYTFIAIDSTDYLIQDVRGYYKGTKDAARELYYVTNDLGVISFEQLDVKYNRPDKVLQAMAYKDEDLLQAYQNAYKKRIQKLGIDTSSFRSGFNVPEADFVNRNAISAEQRNENLSLHVKGSDSKYKLDRFNVWVNEVPIYGQRGISVRKNNANSFDKKISIKLSEGENRIEISITNMNGAESYRKPLLVNYMPGKPIDTKTYFIGIGINNFKDSTNNLKWCVQDIRDLVKAFQTKYPSQFIILDTLFNERVTLSAIKSLKQKLLNTGINDKVIISYSGHGLLSTDFDYFLSSYTTNFKKPEDGSIPYDEFESLLDSIPARKKILFLDACNSGELDKDEVKRINSTEKGLAKNNIAIHSGHKGGAVEITADEVNGKLGIQNSFDLMQSLFVNVGKGTGATIISASGGVQFAQERSELGHGVFTYSIIEASKNFKTIKISALKRYVGDRVTELTSGLQKPTTRNELIASDWDVW